MPYTRVQLLAAVKKDHPELAHLPDNKLFAAIAVDHPDLARGISELDQDFPNNAPEFQSPVYPGGETSRTATDVVTDQAAHVLNGVPQAVLGIPGAIKEGGSALLDMLTGKGSAKGQQIAQGMVQPAVPVAKAMAGNSPLPEDPEWAQAAEGAGTMLASAPVGEGMSRIGGGAVKLAKEYTTRPPLSALTEALSPNDLTFQRHAPNALSEIRAVGVPQNVEEALSHLHQRFEVNEAGAKRVLQPHVNIEIPEYRRALIDAQIEAIPAGATPLERARMIRKAETRIPEKLTIGKVDELRSDMNKRNRSAGKATMQGQQVDVTQTALDEALASSARRVVSDAIDKKGMGGGDALKSYHSRIGDIMHVESALQKVLNQAVAERLSPAAEFTRSARKIVGHPGDTIANGLPKTIDSLVHEAVKNWDKLPVDIPVDFRTQTNKPFVGPKDPSRIETMAGQQQELAPSGAGPLLDPATATPYNPGVQPMDEVLRRQRVGEMPTGPDRPVGQQLDLQEGIPPALFGIEQTPAGAGEAQRPLPLGGDTQLTPPPAPGAQMTLPDVPTERAAWLDQFFKDHPDLSDRVTRLKEIRGF